MVGLASSPANSACSRAWPIPATLPWPKMPKQPANSRCSTPSDSEYWAARNLTTACATVRLTVSAMLALQSGVDLLAGPGAPHPSLLRMVGDPPGPLRPGPGHDVQVVHVVTR